MNEDDDKTEVEEKPKSHKMSETAETKFLETATKRLKLAIKADEDNRKNAVDDLKFLNGDEWDAAEERKRSLRNRPAVKSHVLRKYVNQVIGDMRQNRARVKVRPVDSSGDIEIAKVRSGIIANVEYLSDADAIYDYAGEMLTSCGYGAWRVRERWCEDDPFVQEIYLERLKNPFLVYMDPNARSEIYADAKYGFVLEKVSKDEWEQDERFKDKEFPVNSLSLGSEVGIGQEVWFKDDTVFIADYYIVETEMQTVHMMADGSVLPEDQYDKQLKEWKESEEAKSQAQAIPAPPMQSAPQGQQPPNPATIDVTQPGQTSQPGGTTPPATSAAPAPLPPPEPPEALTVVKTRKIDKQQIKWYAITADQILDGPKDITGRFIPIVLALGPETSIEGKMIRRSMIRDAKDAIRFLDFWITAGAEILAIQPKVPWIGTAKMFEGYEQLYRDANNENYEFLPFNHDPSRPTDKPSREPPPNLPAGIFQQIVFAQDLVKQAIGMFGSDVGDQGPELSGKAILQRQKPGDVGTFQFIDNLSRSIAHSGRIINEKIPKIYDTERDVRIRNIDDTERFSPINVPADKARQAIMRLAPNQQAQQAELQRLQKIARKKGLAARYNDMTVGKYDVVITTGPSFATQRQEAAQALQQLVMAYPKIMEVAGDLVYRFQDFLGAEEIAERLAKGMPAWLVPAKEGEQKMQPPLPPKAQAELAGAQAKMATVETQKYKAITERIKIMKESTSEKDQRKREMLDLLEKVLVGAPQGDQGAGAL